MAQSCTPTNGKPAQKFRSGSRGAKCLYSMKIDCKNSRFPFKRRKAGIRKVHIGNLLGPPLTRYTRATQVPQWESSGRGVRCLSSPYTYGKHASWPLQAGRAAGSTPSSPHASFQEFSLLERGAWSLSAAGRGQKMGDGRGGRDGATACLP